MKKTIFLDFDGVLNWNKYKDSIEFDMKCLTEFNPTNETNKDIKKRIRDFYEYISYDKIQLINQITDNTGAEIVLSTSWRKSYYYVIMKHYKLLGFTGTIIDKTPFYKVRNSFLHFMSNRGIEIHNWIKDNIKDKLDFRFVIIDDNPNNQCGFLISQIPYLIQTDSNTGITQGDVDNAIKILNKYDVE